MEVIDQFLSRISHHFARERTITMGPLALAGSYGRSTPLSLSRHDRCQVPDMRRITTSTPACCYLDSS